jgi:hypothetical protein
MKRRLSAGGNRPGHWIDRLGVMRPIRSMQEASEVTAVRLTSKRRYAKVGDIFRLSPEPGVFLWGRLIKSAKFFGDNFKANLVYVYDAISRDEPAQELLTPTNLIIGPSVVNNLGWVRGYWEIMASRPLTPEDVRDRHLFVRYHGSGSVADYDLVDENAGVVVDRTVDPKSLGQSGYSNFNYIDWLVRDKLEARA